MRILIPESSKRTLRSLSLGADAEIEWPANSWAELASRGGLRWSIPANYGGMGLHGAELLDAYMSLASACLTTSFILSQREAAVRRICECPNTSLQDELLPKLAQGKFFATVGLSHLSTSRQHTAPSLTARETATEFVLDGAIPWVT